MIFDSNLENQPVTLKFPPPKSSIAAFPAREQWFGRLKILNLDILAVFRPSGIDGDISFALDDKTILYISRKFKLKQEMVLETNSSPADVKNGITPIISSQHDTDTDN